MQSKIRVLFASRLDLGLRSGGVQNQIELTRQALEILNVDVIKCNPWNDSLKDIDVCHLFTTSSDLLHYALSAQHRKIPLVVSPIFITPEPISQMKIKANLSRFPAIYTQLRLTRRILEVADAILPLTLEEQVFLKKVFNLPAYKMHVVSNGVEERFFHATPDLFIQKFGFKPDVLFVGRIDQNKNILSLITALTGTRLKLAVIGFPYSEQSYVFEQFKSMLSEYVIYIGHLNNFDPLLPSAYAASRVFCLPSIKEVMPLTVLEGIAAGCQIVITKNSAMGGFLGNSAFFVEPTNVIDIRNKVLDAYNSTQSCSMQQTLLETCTWEKVGRSIRNIYTKLLN